MAKKPVKTSSAEQSTLGKQKLRQVIRKWSKGEKKREFQLDDENYVSYERSIDIKKHHNRQNSLYTGKAEKHLTDLSGVVIEVKSNFVTVRTDDGAYECRTFRSTATENPDSTLVAVGDYVVIKPIVQPTEIQIGEGLITLVKARQTKLSRSRERSTNRSGEAEHVLAGNIDLMFIVSSITEPNIRKGLIDRYLAYAEYERITPVILINKIDLVKPAALDNALEIYRRLNYETICVSVKEHIGIEALKSRLVGNCSVLSGHSGVGKTTLINAITGSRLPIGELSEKSARGAHTTTHAVMLTVRHGESEGYVIDTPGIREFGINWIPKEELRHCFVEFKALAPHCAFSSCTHTTEPDCAVLRGLERGEIDLQRYESYLSLLDAALE
jgi:ribosome biogenesis GTPase / thiamine phosphate phosphatase